MAASRAQLFESLRQTHPTLVRLTSGAQEAALDFRLAEGEWTVREILAHLVDDEMYVMRTRLERIVKEERPHLAPHDERAWYASRNTSRDALPELLADFATQRAASLGIVTMLRDSDWAREGYQPEYGAFSADKWLENWVAHDTTHINQIERILSAHTTTSAN